MDAGPLDPADKLVQEALTDPPPLRLHPEVGELLDVPDRQSLPLDDHVDQPIHALQAVRLGEDREPTSPIRRLAESEPADGVLITAERGEVFEGVADILQRIAGMGVVPIQQAHRPALAPDHVPRARIPVTDQARPPEALRRWGDLPG